MGIINNKLEINTTSQEFYDAFNTCVFSNDVKVLSKLLYKLRFLDLTKDIPGDILEMGVFKGSGIVSWLKIKKIFYPNAFKKVIGFDIFNSDKLINSLSGHDKLTMSNLFEDRGWKSEEKNIAILEQQIRDAGFTDKDFELIKGDVSITTEQFVSERPGARISILYMDVDLEVPTYDSLVNLYNNVSIGGYIIFDEYGYHQWSESKAADRFAKEHGLIIKSLDCQSPTAYIKKI